MNEQYMARVTDKILRLKVAVLKSPMKLDTKKY
jgi:hypothetical protein